MTRAWWLGRRPHGEIHELQQRLFAARKERRVPDTLLFVEHDPVITMGRGAKAEHLLSAEAELRTRGITLSKTDRGGDITLHAPGQLVAYPIIELAPDRRDVRRYVRSLIAVMGCVTREFGVQGGLFEDRVGLWIDRDNPSRWPAAAAPKLPEKIGAVGVRLSRWVTMHGFALNLSTDLELYRHIVPCGIAEYPVTSLQALTGTAPTVQEAAKLALRGWLYELGRGPERVELEELSEAPLSELAAEQPPRES